MFSTIFVSLQKKDMIEILVLLVVSVVFLLVKKKTMGTTENLNYTSNSDILSEKYKSLKPFKSFLLIWIVLLVIGSIISCVYCINIGVPVMIPIIIILTGINIFMIMKFMMIIDFLFDLNNKIDN